MISTDFKRLEESLYKSGDRGFDGVLKFSVGTEIPADKYKQAFVHAAMDLWTIEPNIALTEDFWKLDNEKNVFVKVYEGGSPEPHDKRWSVFPSPDLSMLSIAYKNDPLFTLDKNVLGISDGDLVSAQKSLLKLLSTRAGVSEMLGSLEESERNSFIGRYPELGS